MGISLLNELGWEVWLADLFVNLCIIIALSFVYLQVRFKFMVPRVSTCRLHLVDGVAGGLLSIVLMYYSIQVTDQAIVDLRYVIIMLVVLFTGFKPAIISSLIIAVARLIMGQGIAAYASLPLTLLTLLGFLFIVKYIARNQSTYIKGIYMIVWSNITFTGLMVLVIDEPHLLGIALSVYWIFATLGGVTAIFFIKYMNHSQQLFDKYEAESSIDFLTGLNNVRNFDAVWNMSMQQAVAKRERLSLLAIDIDFFKKVNDMFGHASGDLVLEELGKILKSNARSFDTVSRNGGEEFSVILPDCSKDQAIQVAERIRKGVMVHEFPVIGDNKINITISVGVASYPDTVPLPDNMIRFADECLYQAKRTGRNRVCSEMQ